MQKRILLIVSVIGITALFIAGAYYLVVFLPQKQKASIDLVKLELEAKIEQEKTEQAKIEQEKQRAEEEKQSKLLEEESNRASEDAQQQKEASGQASVKTQQQKTTSASVTKCLADVDAAYKKAVSKIEYPSDNADAVLINLGNQKNQLRNECYK